MLITRRCLLQEGSIAGLMILLASCTPRESRKQPTASPTARPVPPTTQPAKPTERPSTTPEEPSPPAPQPTLPPAVTEPVAGSAYLAVVKGADPEAITRRAIEAIGGMSRFVQPGFDVIIKPNICNASHTFEYASTTNPQVVATLVQLCLEAGAKRVRVMDNPFSGTGEQAYERSGIGPAVEKAGGKMEAMAAHKFIETSIPDGRDLKSWTFYQPILEADLVINVPIAKHHSLARLTLAGKNLMGTIDRRPQMHRNLGQRVADLTSRVRPQLTVMDAVRILMDHGPTGGDLKDVKKLDTVIASHDLVAVDAYTTSLFELKPQDISYIVASADMGLGTMELGDLDIQEIAL